MPNHAGFAGLAIVAAAAIACGNASPVDGGVDVRAGDSNVTDSTVTDAGDVSDALPATCGTGSMQTITKGYQLTADLVGPCAIGYPAALPGGTWRPQGADHGTTNAQNVPSWVTRVSTGETTPEGFVLPAGAWIVDGVQFTQSLDVYGVDAMAGGIYFRGCSFRFGANGDAQLRLRAYADEAMYGNYGPGHVYVAWCDLGGPDVGGIGPGDGTMTSEAPHVQYAIVTVAVGDGHRDAADMAAALAHWASLDGMSGVTRGLQLTVYRSRFQYADNTIQGDTPFITITESRFENSAWWWNVGATPNMAPSVGSNGVATPEAASHVDQILFNDTVRYPDTTDAIRIERCWVDDTAPRGNTNSIAIQPGSTGDYVDVTIADNHILGGGYSLAAGNNVNGTSPARDIVVTGNTFGTRSGDGSFGYSPGMAYPAVLPFHPSTSDPSGPGSGGSAGCGFYGPVYTGSRAGTWGMGTADANGNLWGTDNVWLDGPLVGQTVLP